MSSRLSRGARRAGLRCFLESRGESLPALETRSVTTEAMWNGTMRLSRKLCRHGWSRWTRTPVIWKVELSRYANLSPRVSLLRVYLMRTLQTELSLPTLQATSVTGLCPAPRKVVCMLSQEASSRMDWPLPSQESLRLPHDTWLHVLRQCGMYAPGPPFQLSQEEAQYAHVYNRASSPAPSQTVESAVPSAGIDMSKPFSQPAGPFALPAVNGAFPVTQQQQQLLPGAGMRGDYSCPHMYTAAMIFLRNLKAKELLYLQCMHSLERLEFDLQSHPHANPAMSDVLVECTGSVSCLCRWCLSVQRRKAVSGSPAGMHGELPEVPGPGRSKASCRGPAAARSALCRARQSALLWQPDAAVPGTHCWGPERCCGRLAAGSPSAQDSPCASGGPVHQGQHLDLSQHEGALDFGLPDAALPIVCR